MGQQEQRLAELLLQLRKERGLTQGQFAALIGMHKNSAHRLEKKPSNMTLSTWIRWCSALDVSPYKLLRSALKAPKIVHDETL